MSKEVPIATGPMSAQEAAAAARLKSEDLQSIDDAIMAQSDMRWVKAISVVWDAMDVLKGRFPDLDIPFYAQRLIRLVDEGKLEAEGDLEYLRFSEVRRLD